jgi:hypothetical protein
MENSIKRITDHLWTWCNKSKIRRDAYWTEYYDYCFKNNLLSIPLIVISSLTGVATIANVGTTLDPVVIGWLSTGLAFTTSMLAALQRYFKYGERAEQCKAIAKNYTRIAYNIEFTTNLFNAAETKEIERIVDFSKIIRKDLELLINETNDIPSMFIESVEPDVVCVGVEPEQEDEIVEPTAAIVKSLSKIVKESHYRVRR